LFAEQVLPADQGLSPFSIYFQTGFSAQSVQKIQVSEHLPR